MKRKHSKYVAGEQVPGTEAEFIAIETEPDDRNPYILVNPSDYDNWLGHPGLIAFQFGAYGATRLLVWTQGSDWDSAAEIAGEWLGEYAPGHVTSESDVAQLMKEAQQDDPSLDEEAAYEKATADLYYTEGGWITSHEMHGHDVPKGDPMYEAALQASKEEAVGEPPRGGLATDEELLGQLVQMAAESSELENWKDAEPDDEVREVAAQYDAALWLALNELCNDHSSDLSPSVDASDLWNAEGPYLVLMTLRGEGVGIWDGRWDAFFKDEKGIKRAQAFLEKKLHRFADSSGAGTLNEAFMNAGYEGD